MHGKQRFPSNRDSRAGDGWPWPSAIGCAPVRTELRSADGGRGDTSHVVSPPLAGQAIESADYVLIAEIVNVEHWQQQAELRVQGLADDLEHLVSSRRMLVLERIL